jgi:hypothetical protein
MLDLETLLPDEIKRGLTPAERQVLACTPFGRIADCRTGVPAQDHPAEWANWGPNRSVRAEFLSHLCQDQHIAPHVHPTGLLLRGVRIDGPLNFQGTTILHRLAIVDSAIPQGIDLEDARSRTITLSGSGVSRIRAQGLVVEGTFYLTRTYIGGPLELNAARIGGSLLCEGARIESPGGSVLIGDGISVDGDVNLDDGFHARGEVRLLGATIGGQLSCAGGRFENPGGDAISADDAAVKGGIFLKEGFHATGCTRLLGAQIGRDLDCMAGRFENPEGMALLADSVTVKGTVHLRDGFHATGEVRLRGAEIGGQIGCSGGRFENPAGAALSADQASVARNVFLGEKFHATGAVYLMGADIKGQLVCAGGRFENPGGEALNAESLTVRGSVFLTNGFHASGAVSLLAGQIGGRLSCEGGLFENPGGDALSAQGLRVDLEAILAGARFAGGVNLQSARVGALSDDPRSWPESGALLLDGLEYRRFIGQGTPVSARERLTWIRRQPTDPLATQPYEHLADVLRGMGREEDAVEVMIGKQVDRIRYGRLSFPMRSWRRLLGVTVGHGYKAWRAIVLILALFLAGTAIFAWAFDTGIMVPASADVILSPDYQRAGAVPRDYPGFAPWAYSADVVLPIVDLHQESYWLPDAQRPLGWLVRGYLWFHIAAGWALSSIFVVAVTGLVRS